MLVQTLALVLMPREVRDYVANLSHPAGMVGCRVEEEMSLPCCEYDIVVFGDGKNRVEKLAPGYIVELVHLRGRPRDHLLTLKGMSLHDSALDSQAFAISADLKDITDEKFKRALFVFGRKAFVSSLFCQQRFKLAKEPQVGAMWLKMASYHLIAGTLAIFGTRPMPLHELAQARRAEIPVDAADGIQAALDCIGIERATRPGIARLTEATLELKSKDYDRDLVQSKMQYLLDKSMLADCYYYAGRIAAESLGSRNEEFFRRFAKLIQLAMDLSSDKHQLERLQKSLSLAAKKGLKLAPSTRTTF
jgi:hypothetical protein